MHLESVKVNVITDNYYLYYGVCMLLKKSYRTSLYEFDQYHHNELSGDEFDKEDLLIFDVDSFKAASLNFFECDFKLFFIVSEKNQNVFRDGLKINIDAGLDEFRGEMMKFCSPKSRPNSSRPVSCFSSSSKGKRLNKIDKEIILRTLQGQNVNEISAGMKMKVKTTYGQRAKSLDKLGVSNISGLHSVQHIVLDFLSK
jgi:hypothetical protein